jgi:hypothetical protein
MDRVEFIVEPPDVYPGFPFREYLQVQLHSKTKIGKYIVSYKFPCLHDGCCSDDTLVHCYTLYDIVFILMFWRNGLLLS